MKRSLAIVLSVLMVLSCCTALLSFVAFADAPTFDWATVWYSPDENGTWQESKVVPAEELFDFDYAVKFDGTNLKVGVKFYGTLTGTDASYGNGNGTNFRIWIRKTDSLRLADDFLVDVAYTPSGWKNRIIDNAVVIPEDQTPVDGHVNGNTAYGNFTGTVNVAEVEGGANAEVIIPASILGYTAADTVQVVVSASNKVVKNYCLHSNNNKGGPTSAAVWNAPGELVATADGYSYLDVLGNVLTLDGETTVPGSSAQVAVDANYADLAYGYDAENLYVDINYHAPLATSAADKFGNGAGSFIRLWFYDPTLSATQAYDSYNSFIDIEYHADGTVTDRFLTNTKDGKSNNAIVKYNREDPKPYLVSNTINAAAEDGYTWNCKVTMPLSEITTDASDFQFQPQIAFWGEHPTSADDPTVVTGYSSRIYGTKNDPYNAWLDSSALPYFGRPGFFTDKAVPAEGNIASENVALGCGTEYLFNTTTTSYLGDLTDGFLPSYSYSSTDPQGNKAWRTFPAKTVTGAEISADAVIDLGEEYSNIASIRAYVSQQNSSGIHLPTGIKAYASNDGEAWFDAGSFDCSGLVTTANSNPAWVNLSFTNYLDARYIKISVDNGSAAGFSFLGEVEVNTAELAETAYINDINSYNWGAETDARQYGPILAFGDKKTAAQAISGTTDGGLWFGWWTYLRATWDIDKGAFIVKSLHLASAGEGSEYKTEVMGPYDIVLLTSTAAGAGSYSYEMSHYIWDNVEIGDKLYLYGLETLSASVKGQLEIGEGGEITSQYAVSFKTAALGEDYLYIVDDPAGKTDVDTPYLHTSENLALKKPVTYNASLSSYVGDITDGVKPATGYDEKVWRGLYADTPGNFVIDLGEKYENIGSVNVYHWPTKASGITPANYMKVSVSNDGINYTEVGELDMAQFKDGASGAFNTSVEFDKLVSGRYVKIDFAGHWVFFGEVEVFGYEAIPGAQLLSSYYYGSGEKAILATWLMGDKIDDLNSNLKTHAYWNFASAAWDFEKGAFVVEEVGIGDGSTSDFGDFAIPDFGVVIGAHQTAQAATAQFIAGLKAGDTLYFTENADITNLNAVGIDLDNVWVSTEELGNAYTLAEKYPILTNAGFAGGDITILVPFGTTNTFGGIYEALTGESTDYNYYTAFVVDANGKIIEKYLDLGRPAGVKTDVVIPDGGFAIAYNGGSSIVTNAKLGDTVILNGTTVAALAKAESDFAAEFALDDQLVWNDTLTDVSYSKYHAHEYIDKVVAPTCTEDGYTEHKCLCGEELEKTDIVAAAGHPDLTAVELQTHPSTCVEHGYTYKVCPACNEEVVIETGLPLIDHDYVETAIGPFVKHACSVCGDYYYTDAKDNTEGIKDIKISHFISFNWNTFEAMIIPGDGVKKPNEIQTNGFFALSSYRAYLLEATDVAGVYYASAFADNAATYKDTQLAVGQYLLLFSANNDMYSFASTGALKGWYFADHDAELATSKGYAIDTSASEPRHMYAMFVSADYTEYNNAVEAAGKLVETDWTAESWANLQSALAANVKGCSINEQEKVDNATAAIRTAINNLVKAAADIVLGDFDGDKEFTAADLIKACQVDAGAETATEAQLAALDVDGDGDYTAADLIYMCQYDAGIITVWPAEAEPVE